MRSRKYLNDVVFLVVLLTVGRQRGGTISSVEPAGKTKFIIATKKTRSKGEGGQEREREPMTDSVPMKKP
jgi:hypothetical protein